MEGDEADLFSALKDKIKRRKDRITKKEKKSRGGMGLQLLFGSKCGATSLATFIIWAALHVSNNTISNIQSNKYCMHSNIQSNNKGSTQYHSKQQVLWYRYTATFRATMCIVYVATFKSVILYVCGREMH